MQLEKYLGLAHTYGRLDCITLVRLFYEQEFGIYINLPTYSHSRRWMTEITVEKLDYWAKQCAEKVSLTDAKNYDLIVFKSFNSNFITHFGLFLMPNRMLHVEEEQTSSITTLSDYWVERIHAVYRLYALV